jgi:hypothetical protein
MKCPECFGELPDQSGSGRPRTYCGEVCRRSAEYRIKRARRLAESLETQLVKARIEYECLSGYRRGSETARRMKAIAKELELAEERILDLVRASCGSTGGRS